MQHYFISIKSISSPFSWKKNSTLTSKAMAQGVFTIWNVFICQSTFSLHRAFPKTLLPCFFMSFISSAQIFYLKFFSFFCLFFSFFTVPYHIFFTVWDNGGHIVVSFNKCLPNWKGRREILNFALKSLHFQLLMKFMLHKKYERGRKHNNPKLV